MEFIFMLTHHDATVANALEVYEDIRSLPLRFVGFKDIGLALEELGALTAAIHADGREVMLEVVSERADDELRSIHAARALGVDWVLGGTHADEAVRALEGSGLRYCPFPGRVTGHPSILEGSIDEIAHSAESLTSRPQVHGLDLLAYRHAGDVPALVSAVVAATPKPVIAAGSVDSVERIRDLRRLGVWGFTVGGAVFEGRFPAPATARDQIAAILEAAQA